MDMTRGHRFSRPDSESPAVCIGCGDPWSDEYFPARECPHPAEGITGQEGPVKRRHLIVFTSDEERTEIRMDLTPEEAQLLVRMARSINSKAKWSADVRMAISDSATPQAKD